MSVKEIMAKFIKGHEEFDKGDINALDEVYAPDVLVQMPPLPDVRGLEAIKQAAADIRQGFTDIRFEWGEAISEGNTAAHRFTMRMKHTGVNPIFPVPPTGKEVVLKGCLFYHVKNNKIVEQFEYADLLGFLQQLGVVPPMGQQ